MQLTKNGMTISLDDAQVVDLVLERLGGKSAPQLVQTLPPLGQAWPGMGGHYVGILRGLDGEPDHHLVKGPDFDGEASWSDMLEWAKNLTFDGHTGFDLPTRREQRLLLINAPELFQPAWYWSRELHADDSGCAWMQDFGGGGQYYILKSGRYRGCAVRRLDIR